MKKVLAAVTLLVFILLTGCESGESLLGTVIRMDEETMVVEPFEGEEIRRSGTEVSVSVPDDLDLEVGDQVRVTHEGPVMESHPLQITVIAIEELNGLD